jgi:hypothetical protein
MNPADDNPTAPLDSEVRLSGPESSFGANNYEKKLEQMEKMDDEMFTMDNVMELGNFLTKFVREDVPKGAVNVFKNLKTSVTPAFIKRMNSRKIHLKHVEDADS